MIHTQLFVTFFVIYTLRQCTTVDYPTIQHALTESYIVPTLILTFPKDWCTVTFPSGTEFDGGNKVPVKTIRRRPQVTWEADPNKYYLLTMHGLSRYRRDGFFHMNNTIGRVFLHWMVANIPACYVEKGDEWYEYTKPLIPPNTITDCYVVMVHEQPAILNISKPHEVFGEYFEKYLYFDDFLKDYNISDPIAINFATIRF